MCSDFVWKESRRMRMLNKVASTFQVERRADCLANCSVSPVCDSYNYRVADRTCQLNTHDTLRGCYPVRRGCDQSQLNTHDTPLVANSSDIVDDGDWGWWKTQFVETFWSNSERPENPTATPLGSNVAKCWLMFKFLTSLFRNSFFPHTVSKIR